MSDFHFCPEIIIKNCLESRDTARDTTVKKIFFSKVLKNVRSVERFQKAEDFSKYSNT